MTMGRGSRSPRRGAPVPGPVALALAALVAGVNPSARADDRPFLRTGTAIVEDDDERVFEVHGTVQAGRRFRGLGLQVEYAFSPTFSLEFEWSRTRDRLEGESSREIGLGARLAWVDPAREGWGLATRFSVERERESDDGWARPAWKGVLAWSLPAADRSAWLHANVGARYQPAEPGERRWTGLWSVAAQQEITRHTVLFAEAAGARGGTERLAQVGVRHWLRREKVALDLALGRHFDLGPRGGFVVLGLSFHDISP